MRPDLLYVTQAGPGEPIRVHLKKQHQDEVVAEVTLERLEMFTVEVQTLLLPEKRRRMKGGML